MLTLEPDPWNREVKDSNSDFQLKPARLILAVHTSRTFRTRSSEICVANVYIRGTTITSSSLKYPPPSTPFHIHRPNSRGTASLLDIACLFHTLRLAAGPAEPGVHTTQEPDICHYFGTHPKPLLTPHGQGLTSNYHS